MDHGASMERGAVDGDVSRPRARAYAGVQSASSPSWVRCARPSATRRRASEQNVEILARGNALAVTPSGVELVWIV